jgi:membrane-associated phospholipid phosphatase
MDFCRRFFILGGLSVLAMVDNPLGAASAEPAQVMQTWYRLVLELVRHTPTYTPPVASRAFAYAGVTGFEALAGGNQQLQSLAGQLQGLTVAPQRETGQEYSEAVVLHAALASTIRHLFSNTGPTGQRAMNAMEAKLGSKVADGVPTDVVERSEAYGRAVAAHIQSWAAKDGGAVIENMGFPLQMDLPKSAQDWVPTSMVRQQQYPLLPRWGKNRSFAMPNGASCPIEPPPAYSEDKPSAFYAEALEVYETRKNLTGEQTAIARFWADDAMLSKTPPGHWIHIAMNALEKEQADAARSAEVLARLGIGLADAFIGNWDAKYQYNLLRPVTYIRRVIDPKWEPILLTPPFPEYPSGHSTQSGAAADVLSALFGENYAFVDNAQDDEGLPPRSFASFRAAAEEAGISRLYGGIHFRAAIVNGLEQGRCIAAFTNALRTRR